MIEEIKHKFTNDEFEFSKHAADQSILRGIAVKEIKQAISTGEIIEDYPFDKYGPSCLIFGFTAEDRPLHVQCSQPSRSIIKIVTCYEPDPKKWIDRKIRRKSNEPKNE